MVLGISTALEEQFRLGNRVFFLLPVKGLISVFFLHLSMDLLENVSFGASPVRTSVASIPAFFLLCHFCEKTLFCMIVE